MAKKRARSQSSRARKRASARGQATSRRTAAKKRSVGKSRVTKSAARKPTGKKPTGKRPAAKPTAAAMSLHIGLNSVNPADYSGWSGPLAACEFDARDMAALAKSQGITPTILMTKKATRAATIAALREASTRLKTGDLFFLSYSGHGGQVDDVSGEETDKLDETWCLYDGELIDDELYLELSRFAKGVRIVVLSDSCHSGTVTRAKPSAADPNGRRSRMMPPDIARKVYVDHRDFYDQLQRDVANESKAAALLDPDAALSQVTKRPGLHKLTAKCNAAVILISGCQDDQTSMDGDHNGAFTEQLLKVWSKGTYRGNYTKFHAAITSGLPSTQRPNLYELGAAAAFVKQQPFSV